MPQEAREFQARSPPAHRLGYLRFAPPGHDAGGAARWPLLLFLHGSGERGDDVTAVARHGIPRLVLQRPDFPFIAISPQCPAGTGWGPHMTTLVALLDHVLESHAVDPARVYLTGISMGGFGAWQLAAREPARFAAVVPICGGGSPAKVRALRRVPVWAFHGEKDESVPLEASVAMVDALRACGGDVRLTVYPDVGHDAWTRTYEDPALYAWLLAHRRG